ncbi:unnamed protein product [Lactuca saligna]|uniref:Phytocyanin domain-containing protein n=1 Tax=Lactuca saligna TaxID=75948 RepID=A0AA35Y867_LACSI|nr:unnamed protein product [Lactuca saligna]
MKKVKPSLVVLMTFMVVASMDFHGSTAKEFMVGGPFGWGVPQNHKFYDKWSNHHIFKPHDMLIFNFTGEISNNDVAEVTREAYLKCDVENPISRQTTNLSRFKLTNTSTNNHYYICTIHQNCKLGQKLAIMVSFRR